jgi:parallel beta-helix repeat protein
MTRAGQVRFVSVAVLVGTIGLGCSSSSGGSASSSGSTLCTGTGRCVAIQLTESETNISAAFSSVQDGDTIAFAPGTYHFRNQLALGKASNVTVIGSGMGQTILDFGGQLAAGDSLYTQDGSSVIFEGFTVQNSPGNGIKTLNVTGVTFRNLAVTWLGLNSADGGGSGDAGPPPAGSSDGPYGLYPVTCKNVLIEHCSISGASDSGIYVGQSQHVVVRRNDAFSNVAGIEIENSFFVDVYENYAHDNSAGILVFDLPKLKQEGGHSIRVFHNTISANNRVNFAAQGDIVGLVPTGTGFFVMANHDVEVFGNSIEGNNTANAGIISYFLPGLLMPANDAVYYQWPYNIYLHDNVYAAGGTMPDTTGAQSGQIGSLIASGKSKYPGGLVPDVSYDGVTDPAKGTGPNPMMVCIQEASTATFGNGHYDQIQNLFATDAVAQVLTTDVTPYACMLPPVPAVSFTGLTP